MSGLVTRRNPVTSSVIERAAATGLSKAREALSGAGGGVPDLVQGINYTPAGGSIGDSGWKGTTVSPTEEISLYGIDFYIGAADDMQLSVWNADTQTILATVLGTGVINEWVRALFDSPVVMDPAVNYYIGMWANSYTSKSSTTSVTFDSRLTNVEDTRYGGNSTDPNIYPTSLINDGRFFGYTNPLIPAVA